MEKKSHDNLFKVNFSFFFVFFIFISHLRIHSTGSRHLAIMKRNAGTAGSYFFRLNR